MVRSMPGDIPTAPWDKESELASEFTVRQPKTAEMDRINQLYVASWRAAYGSWGLRWSDRRVLEEFHEDKLPASCWLVVEYGDRIVGFLRHSSCLRRLDKIFVEEAYWRTGAGYALIREYFWRVAREHKDPVKLHLEVFAEHERAVRFFNYFGFEDSGIRWTAPTSKRELCIMEKHFVPLS